jgi:arsenate reductase
VSAAGKKRVLFVCIGNACRSQMAEGFARAYGSDVIVPTSVGVVPWVMVARDSIRAMDEKNIDIRGQFPKALRDLGSGDFDLIVNMTGSLLPPEFKGKVLDWKIADPFTLEYKEHCEVRDLIESRVMKLILELRTTAPKEFRGQGSERLTP